MDLELVFALSRSFERLGIVALAGLTLWCGYRLFSIVTEADARGKFEGQGFKFSFSRVGPGVFFALFGSVMLIYALLSPLELPVQVSTSDGAQKIRYGMAGRGDPSYKAVISSLNELELISAQLKVGDLSSTDQDRIIDAVSQLHSIRGMITDAEFNIGTYAEYSMIRETCQRDPARCEEYLTTNQKHDWFERVDDFNQQIDRQ